MIEILPADDATAAHIAANEKIETPVSAMLLSADGETGYVLYRVDRDTLELLAVRAPDAVLEEGLIRAALNAGVNRLAITAVCRNPDLFLLLRSLGFCEKEGEMSVFIPDFFTRPCAGNRRSF